MSFAERVLSFSFSGAQSGNFTAAGLRAAVSIQSYPDRIGSTAQVKIWGLTLAQMNAYSSKISAGVGAEQFNLVIQAGNLGEPLTELLNGPIYRSRIVLSGAPDSLFEVTMIDTYMASTPIAAQSQPGSQNAEDLIANVCAAANLTLDNTAGAHAVLRNQSTYGSVIDQVSTIAKAAKFGWKIYGSTLFIWPKGQPIDDTIITVGADTDPPMVGYPAFWEAGLIVTSQYNQQVQVGRQMKVLSSIPKAQGIWEIVQVEHDLTTMLSKGPWFTTAILGAPATP